MLQDCIWVGLPRAARPKQGAQPACWSPPEAPPVTDGPEKQLLSKNLRDCSIAGVEDLGGGEYVATFLGDCQAASEEYYDFSVTLDVRDEKSREPDPPAEVRAS